MNKDLTVGKPSRVLLQFCLPLFASVIFQQLYNIADSFVAGRFVGEAALAAVGNSYEVTLIFIAFGTGCNMGCSVVTAQLFGGKQYGRMKTAISTAMLFTGGLCALLMTLGFCFSGRLLVLMQTPGEILENSRLYLNIYILGLPFLFFYNLSNGIFSALGDTKTPFYFLAVSSVSNIFVDIFFTTALSGIFTRGVDGVAWATFLCQGVSCVLAMTVVSRRLKGMETREPSERFSWELLRRFLTVAVPSMLQQGFVSLGNIVIQGRINSFGSGVIAGYAAAIKLNNLVITGLVTLGNGISNFAAQNLGARKIDRIRSGFRSGLGLVWGLCVPFSVLYVLAGRSLSAIFLEDGEGMRTSIRFLQIVAPFYAVVAAKLVADGILRGMGYMKPFVIATFTDLLLRVGLAFVFSAQFGPTGIWMAWPVGWSIATIVSVAFYRTITTREFQNKPL